MKDAVPATSVTGFRVLPWTQPSVAHLSSGITLPTYTGVDASGRLIVETYRGTNVPQLGTVRLYDAPGQPPAPLRPPVPPGGSNGARWYPAFTGDGRLLWTSTRLQGAPHGVNTVHVTDLAGGQDVSIPVGSVNDGVRVWVTGDRAWYEAQQSVTSQGTEIRRLYTESLSSGAPARLVARDVLAADVSEGVAAWVTTDGQVHLAQADGSGAHTVPVPLGPGCTLTRGAQLSLDQAVAVTSHVIALSETCGTGADELLAFDTNGRLLVHVKGLSVRAVSLSGAFLAVGGVDGQPRYENLVYNLRTGTFAVVGRSDGLLQSGTPAGRRPLRPLVRRRRRARGGVHAVAPVRQTGGMDIVSPAINDYLLAHSEPADEVLRDLADGDPPRARWRGGDADQPRRGRAADHAGPAGRRPERGRGRDVHRLLLDLHRPWPRRRRATALLRRQRGVDRRSPGATGTRAGVADRIDLRIAPAVDTLRALPGRARRTTSRSSTRTRSATRRTTRRS